MWNVLLLVPVTVSAGSEVRRSYEARALSRSLALGSSLVAALFVVLGGALSRLPAPVAPEIPVFEFEDFVLEKPPSIEPSPGAVTETGPPRVDPNALIRPVIPLEPEVSTPMVGDSPIVGPTSDGLGPNVERPGTPARDFAPVAEETPDVHFVPDEDPVPIFAPKPEYPDLAMQAQVEGTVVVRALVRRDGRVGETRVERGIPLLNEAAVAAVSRWTFAPARTNRVAVSCWVVVPVRFRLNDVR